MGRKAAVPITPAVLDWATAESGLSLSEVAAGVGVEERNVEAWRAGNVKPAITELRRLAKRVHDEARSFTLFHECGHLLTRTDSACAAAPATANAGDNTERWCEAFAAATLIPASALGPRTIEMFVSAVKRDIISESQALDYLDIPSSELERLTTVDREQHPDRWTAV